MKGRLAIAGSKNKGDLTELEVATEVVRAGYNICFPYGDRERYDFVIDLGNRFIRVQVKTCKETKWRNGFAIDCRSTNKVNGTSMKHHYTDKEVDYMATSFNGKAYLIPIGECYATKTLRFKASVNCSKVSWAQDYEVKRVLDGLSL